MSTITHSGQGPSWRDVARHQGRVQHRFGGTCVISMAPIGSTQALGTALWTVKWSCDVAEAHICPFRSAWAHYPHPVYATVPQLLDALLDQLEEKLGQAEHDRRLLGLAPLREMVLSKLKTAPKM